MPTLVTLASHKIPANMRYSMSKDTAFNRETLLPRTILCSKNPVRITWQCQIQTLRWGGGGGGSDSDP